MSRSLGLTAIASLVLMFAVPQAWAQRPAPEHPIFGHTLHQGTGYIAVPHAFVPRNQLFFTGTVVAPESFRPVGSTTADSYTLTRGAVGVALAGFLEVGGTIHTADTYTGFAKLQIVKQTGIFPAIAAGVMNIPLAGDETGRYGIEDAFYDDFFDAASFYGVFTYTAGPGRTSFPSWVTISAGWGSGIFQKDNPQIEDSDRTGGFFGAVSFDFQAADEAFIRFITEWDGFDVNLAATAWLSGLEVTAGVLSVGKGDAPEPLPPGAPLEELVFRTFAGQFYNQIKPFVTITIDLHALGAIPWIWTSEEE